MTPEEEKKRFEAYCNRVPLSKEAQEMKDKVLESFNDGKKEVPEPDKKPDKKQEPEKESFVPYNTMFKLNVLQRIGVTSEACGPRFVECVACGWGCELESVLLGEVHEYQCPECQVTTWEYYKDKPHQEVNNAEDNEEI